MESPSRKRFVKPERRWGVVVGISRYQHLDRQDWLLSGRKDAEAFAQFLQSPRGGGMPDSNLKLLLDEQATGRAIRLALDFVITQARSGDVVTIFFAGHGKVVQYGSGEIAYLLPHDADLDLLNVTAIPMDEIRRYVDVHLRQAAQVVMVTDACHAGALGGIHRDGASRIGSINDHLQVVGQRDGVLNIMACRRDEVAIEDSRLGGHGVLTYALLKALNGDGPSYRSIVRNQELLDYVMRQVPRLTEQEQHPRHGSNYTDEFPLSNLSLPGPAYQVPDLSAEAPLSASAFPASGATVRVVGAPLDSELYLVQDSEQRSLGRVLSESSVLVSENVPQGAYELVRLLGSERKSWPIEIRGKLQTVNLRSEEFQ